MELAGVAFGLLIWATILYFVFIKKRDPEPDGCPQCGHEAGLDDDRRCCPEIEDYSGWVSDQCRCTNDYHWNYVSVRE